MAHRNRWFTYIPMKNGGSFHGYVQKPDGISSVGYPEVESG